MLPLTGSGKPMRSASALSSGDLRLNQDRLSIDMTTESNQKDFDPGLTPVAGDHALMDSESLYRERERGYRQSEQYASMQRLYPQLRLWMSLCQQSDLVSDSILDWERSHGDI